MTWRSILICFAISAAILWAFQAFDEHYYWSRYHPPPPALASPPMDSVAHMVEDGAWTPAQAELAQDGVVLKHDPDCADGFDTSAAHAGELCLP